MRKIWLVARHEFSVTLSRLAYRIFVASVPALALITLVGVAVFQAVRADAPPASTVLFGYVDLTAGADGQPRFTRFQQQGGTAFTRYPDRQTATAALLADTIERLFVFPADYLESGLVVEVRREHARVFAPGWQGSALRHFILQNLASGKLAPEQLERVLTPYRLVIAEVAESGAPAAAGPAPGERLIFIAVSLLLLVSVLTASGYLLQGLAEEKESRIMEVLLSSLAPEQLMLGKLIGLGAASLLQVAVWAASGVVSLLVLARMVELSVDASYAPSAGWLLVALAYFLLGYALIGTLLAAIGAVTTNQRQAGNITALVLMPVMAPMWFLSVLLDNPESLLARVLSFVPFTAPVASLMRLSLGGMGGLEVLASLAVLASSVALVVWLTTRLFRAYLLTYGQPPGPGDLLRTLRGG